jgi:tRNA modification GTPase
MCLSGPRPLMVKPDVIAAIATAPGRAAIGVVRLSGPDLDRVLPKLLGRTIPARRAILTDFLDSEGIPLDRGIALFFPAPHSYTGEDVLELQGHGGSAVLSLLLRRCVQLGARLAAPGEFSRRAFLNGKLDLAQAESVADLIEASSEAAARAAVRSLKGEFSKEINVLCRRLIDLRALVEAWIDFSEDVDAGEEEALGEKLSELRQQIAGIERLASSGSVLRDGLRVVLVGQPNVGKSSLLNCLAGDDVAIVTEVAGTTRDAVRADLFLEGVPVHIVDTAGLREPQDTVERIGIERTWTAAHGADIVLLIADAREGLTNADRRILAQLEPHLRCVVVMNKIDLINAVPARNEGVQQAEIWVSAKTGSGIKLVEREILDVAGWKPSGEGVFLARQRHLHALRSAAEHLDLGQSRLGQLELVAEDLRLAQMALGEITGEFSADDLLGEIFSRFCIGK